VVAGIAMARYGQNALEVIHNLKDKIAEIGPGLPEGVTVQTVYDRSELIHRAIETLKGTLIEESIIVALVCVVFLMHVRSALVAILMLPVGVLMAFIAMRLLGMNSNLMSLGGIAIAIGAMIDAAIVMIENAHKHLERLPEGQRPSASRRCWPPARKWGRRCSSRSDHHRLLPAGVHAGRPGRPAVLAAGLHQDLLDGRRGDSVGHPGAGADAAVHPRQDHAGGKNPVNRVLIWLYRPIIAAVMRWKKLTIVLAVIALAVSVYPASRLGSEFMPTLNEGTCSTCRPPCRACRSPRPPS
jgi:Cu(I)/Ag(I) efflux system membrane protein CusA/SilA